MAQFAETNERARKAWQAYERLRPIVETPENIGKIIVIDIDSGDYEIDHMDELGFEASDRLQTRHPASKMFSIRIGYKAMETIGGVRERLDGHDG